VGAIQGMQRNMRPPNRRPGLGGVSCAPPPTRPTIAHWGGHRFPRPLPDPVGSFAPLPAPPLLHIAAPWGGDSAPNNWAALVVGVRGHNVPVLGVPPRLIVRTLQHKQQRIPVGVTYPLNRVIRPFRFPTSPSLTVTATPQTPSTNGVKATPTNVNKSPES